MHNYEVIYDDIVIYKITVLIKSLKQSRIRRFEDSGLEELLLTSKYEEELDKFGSEIVDFTRNKLNSGMLGEIQEKNEKFYIKKIVLNIRSYTLVLQCKQYLKEKIILVYDLEIMK